MKKELLAGTKGLVTTLMVAMAVVCIFQLFSAIGNFANKEMSNKNCFILSYYRYFEFGIALCFWYIYIYTKFV